tara:strand:- start:496 stop:987 length:492 start_codon:yes stop_codon:yes gene_type:complete
MTTLSKKLFFLTLTFSLGSFSAQSSDLQEFNNEGESPCQTTQELEKDLFRFIAGRTYPEMKEEKKNTVIGALYAEEWSKTRQQYDLLAALHYFKVAINDSQDEDAHGLREHLVNLGEIYYKDQTLEAFKKEVPYSKVAHIFSLLYRITSDPFYETKAEFYKSL